MACPGSQQPSGGCVQAALPDPRSGARRAACTPRCPGSAVDLTWSPFMAAVSVVQSALALPSFIPRRGQSPGLLGAGAAGRPEVARGRCAALSGSDRRFDSPLALLICVQPPCARCACAAMVLKSLRRCGSWRLGVGPLFSPRPNAIFGRLWLEAQIFHLLGWRRCGYRRRRRPCRRSVSISCLKFGAWTQADRP